MDVSKLGRATLKGNIDVERTNKLLEDIAFARSLLHLATNLHLLYLITPFNLVCTVRPLPKPYFEVIDTSNNLSA